ncbi:hypothetical protein [Streptosporangium sp. NPDC049376]|uniref:Cap15 family cyclic dinucleotide receptor domain-containing protein n=1 Tax=Streptosporangium sp. NPDC049376 TaxID=3366192 RepID=UPI0037BD21C6
MPSHAQFARWGATVLSIAYAIALYATGVHPQTGVGKAISYVPTVISLAVVAFDKWLWRIPGIHRLVGRPRLDGTWKATLRPTLESRIPEGGNRGPINAYVMIEQTYWSISITLITVESMSHSRGAVFNKIADGDRNYLSFVYGNRPRQEHALRSPPHIGAVEWAIAGRTPQEISGHYWTDRLTTGDMQLQFVGRASDHESFRAAHSEYLRSKKKSSAR